MLHEKRIVHIIDLTSDGQPLKHEAGNEDEDEE